MARLRRCRWHVAIWRAARPGDIQCAGLWNRRRPIWGGGPAPARGDNEDQAVKETRAHPLRLPRSLNDEVARLSLDDRTSIDQFVATAALQTAKFFMGGGHGRLQSILGEPRGYS